MPDNYVKVWSTCQYHVQAVSFLGHTNFYQGAEAIFPEKALGRDECVDIVNVFEKPEPLLFLEMLSSSIGKYLLPKHCFFNEMLSSNIEKLAYSGVSSCLVLS